MITSQSTNYTKCLWSCVYYAPLVPADYAACSFQVSICTVVHVRVPVVYTVYDKKLILPSVHKLILHGLYLTYNNYTMTAQGCASNNFMYSNKVGWQCML